MHTEIVLHLLDSQKCYACGGSAVSGAKICGSCAHELTLEELVGKKVGADAGAATRAASLDPGGYHLIDRLIIP